ncbi:DUF397 domain-containing protein [Streptomyces sp. NPDC059611]|uniref:DUF397 domain-containing protein n=1 Tax=Streptomyces sp. NPDC059611 TaxID=3346884 RepID=UPI0036A55576
MLPIGAPLTVGQTGRSALRGEVTRPDQTSKGPDLIIPNSSSLPVTWWKSSASHAHSECLECGIVDADHIAVRDSRTPNGPALVFGRGAPAAMVGAVAAGLLRLHADERNSERFPRGKSLWSPRTRGWSHEAPHGGIRMAKGPYPFGAVVRLPQPFGLDTSGLA